MEEIKKVYDDLRTGWEEMKHLLEQQNAEVKKLGEATAETKAAIEKVNEHVSEADAKQAEIVARIDKSEVTKSRPGRSDEVAPALEAKAAMFKMLRYGYNSLDKEEKALFKTARAGSDYEAKAISLGDETQAGFLAPPELVHDIIHEVVLFSPIRNVANVRSTSAKSVLLPIRTGKAAATWIQEVGQRSPGANPTFGMLEVPTHEMYSEILISEQDLEDDQFNIEGEISRSIGEQFGVAEGLAFVSGDGVKQPEGLLTAAGIAYSPGGDANLLLANGLITASYGCARPTSWPAPATRQPSSAAPAGTVSPTPCSSTCATPTRTASSSIPATT